MHAPVACALAANALAISRVSVLQWEHPQKKTAFTTKAFVDVPGACSYFAIGRSNPRYDHTAIFAIIFSLFLFPFVNDSRLFVPPLLALKAEGKSVAERLLEDVRGGFEAISVALELIESRSAADSLSRRQVERHGVNRRRQTQGRGECPSLSFSFFYRFSNSRSNQTF